MAYEVEKEFILGNGKPFRRHTPQLQGQGKVPHISKLLALALLRPAVA